MTLHCSLCLFRRDFSRRSSLTQHSRCSHLMSSHLTSTSSVVLLESPSTWFRVSGYPRILPLSLNIPIWCHYMPSHLLKNFITFVKIWSVFCAKIEYIIFKFENFSAQKGIEKRTRARENEWSYSRRKPSSQQQFDQPSPRTGEKSIGEDSWSRNYILAWFFSVWIDRF